MRQTGSDEIDSSRREDEDFPGPEEAERAGAAVLPVFPGAGTRSIRIMPCRVISPAGAERPAPFEAVVDPGAAAARSEELGLLTSATRSLLSGGNLLPLDAGPWGRQRVMTPGTYGRRLTAFVAQVPAVVCADVLIRRSRPVNRWPAAHLCQMINGPPDRR
jgi:hypothetical protein